MPRTTFYSCFVAGLAFSWQRHVCESRIRAVAHGKGNKAETWTGVIDSANNVVPDGVDEHSSRIVHRIEIGPGCYARSI